MYTCQVVTDSNACVTFEKYLTVLGPFFLKPPKHDQWWGWDLNLGGNRYMVSMRQHKGEYPEYILWNCYNSTLTTGSSILTTKDLPVKQLLTLILGFISNGISAHWTRWRLCIPRFDAFKMKCV